MTRRRAMGLAGGCLLSVFALAATVTAMNHAQGPEAGLDPFLPPSWEHPLGSDDMGGDIWSMLWLAGRYSLVIGVFAALISVGIGGAVGLASGYFRGPAGEIWTAVIDVVALIPFLPLMVILAAYLGPNMWNIILAIALLGWCSTARAVRAKVLQLREAPFVEALVALGISRRRLLARHLLPNVAEIVAAKFVLAVAGAMLGEAALSFLGLGDPARLSWGGMMHYAFKRGGIANGLWNWYLPPGLCIGLCTLGFVLVGMYWESPDSSAARPKEGGDAVD